LADAKDAARRMKALEDKERQNKDETKKAIYK
jgi:hypothetical protein